tara:strand:- start:68 stop:481 length:414 start_codon:yes stop_codon:yes gene_type:complete
MTFLYITFGIAMISGISAMLTIGNNINNLSLLSAFRKNQYYESSLPGYDRRILDILNNYTGPDSEVCLNIKENINETLYEESQTFSTNSLFLNSCVLVNRNLNHRVLIKKNNLGNFNLFSCYLNKYETYCPYELDND